MKKLLLLALLIMSIFNSGVFSAPDISHTNEFYVNDFANVLSDDVEKHIVDIGKKLCDRTTAQVVVVTVSTTGDEDIFDYSLNLAREWGIGGSEKDNGCLIFISVDDRKSYIQVGYGLEGRLTDGKTGKLQDDYLISYLKEGDYDNGIKNLFNAIVSEVYTEYNISPDDDIKPKKNSDPDDIYVFIIIPLIIFAIVFWAWWDNNYGSGPPPSYGSSGGSGRSSSGGGSSSSSGGGGSFGGGGSGRSW